MKKGDSFWGTVYITNMRASYTTVLLAILDVV